jgi:hypothetical protein
LFWQLLRWQHLPVVEQTAVPFFVQDPPPWQLLSAGQSPADWQHSGHSVMASQQSCGVTVRSHTSEAVQHVPLQHWLLHCVPGWPSVLLT